jgi:glycosyltransferase involved in cell wall biosynthesis
VASGGGWFSDRSVCYLASGRPVLAQDTGFSPYLPTGDGLLRFRSAEDLAAGVEDLRRDYDRHRRAARAIAEETFDSDHVLTRLLGRL